MILRHLVGRILNHHRLYRKLVLMKHWLALPEGAETYGEAARAVLED